MDSKISVIVYNQISEKNLFYFILRRPMTLKVQLRKGSHGNCLSETIQVGFNQLQIPYTIQKQKVKSGFGLVLDTPMGGVMARGENTTCD